MSTSDITARLERYVPTSLSSEAWSAARDVVISAVLACDPPDPLRAQVWASALSGFLASRTAWDKKSAPDLAALVTPAAIATYAPAVSTSSVRQYRAMLRRIAVAVGTMEPQVNAAPHPKKDASTLSSSYWPHVVDEGPFVLLDAVYAAHWGPFTYTTWRGIDDLALDLELLIEGGFKGSPQ